MNTHNVIASAVAGIVLVCSMGAYSHDSTKEKITVLQDHPALNAPGKKVLMLTVDYLPGQESVPHSHAGTTLAYVLEGEITSRVNDGKEITYTPGQSWYEPAGAKHYVSKNASATQPAKLLVYMVLDEKDPVLTPLGK